MLARASAFQALAGRGPAPIGRRRGGVLTAVADPHGAARRRRTALRSAEDRLHPDLGARVAVVIGDFPEAVGPIQGARRLHPPLGVEAHPREPEGARLLEARLKEPAA